MNGAPILKILSQKESEKFHFEIQSELFVTLQKSGSTEAVGMIFPSSTVGQKKCIELLDEAAKRFAVPLKELSLKAIGDPKLFPALKSKLESEGKLSKSYKESPLPGKNEILFYPKDGKVKAAAQAPEVSEAPKGKTKVLIVDDSKTIRSLLERIFKLDENIEVIGSIENPLEVEKFLQTQTPDVITLDIHMPHLNGVELLHRILPKYPIPTVMISSISMEEGPMVLSALEAGAVDYIQKPSFEEIKQVAPLIIEKVKDARQAKVRISSESPKTQKKVVKEKPIKTFTAAPSLGELIVIGSSTGGTEALKELLTRLPDEIPPILIVQHIPPVFSKSFADRMNQLCQFEVKEGEAGDVVAPNRVLIAPGGTQMGIKKSGDGLVITVDPAAEPVNRHKPSVDYLFDQVSKFSAKKTVGVILTGMGADGAKGLLNLKNAGAQTFGQDEASCVVYGMPQAAFKLGAVEKQVTLLKMADEIMTAVKSTKKKAA
jgi:two-component system, chemotaxis family, protein-glutamate methylesterase/glutaminase